MRYGLFVLPLLLLAGCGDPDPEPNASRTVVITGNDNELIVPRPRGTEDAVINGAAVAIPAVRLAADGVELASDTGPSRRAVFGMPRAAVTQLLAAALGNPIEEGDSQECGAGALGFANFREGLGLYFQDGKFVGWDVDGRDGGRFATASGIGIGATRKQLEAAGKVSIEDSTLGIEFTADGLSGLLGSRDPDGEVTNLWAGATCIAR